MNEKIYLGVKNHDTGEYFVTAGVLPVQIGRQHDVNNQLLLDPQYRTISRVHGMIEQTSRGYVYTDSSASGSRVGGLVVRDSRVALSPNFQIEIENYTITRVDIMPFIILSTDADLNEKQRLELLPGRGLGVAESGRNNTLIDLNRWDEWDKEVAGQFELVEETPVWAMSGHAHATIRKNKSTVTQPRTPLASLDVIEVGTTRFEVLHPHENRIVCGYDRCHLLNPPPIEANCRFCGRHLANAGGFSRVL